MLDLKFIRKNPDVVRAALEKRGFDFDLARLLDADEEWRQMLFTVEQLKNRRNAVSEEIARLKKERHPADDLITQMREVSQRIKDLDEDIRRVDERLQDMLLQIPNIPQASVPFGRDESDNQEVRRWGEPPQFTFEAKAHWDVGEGLDIVDFQRGGKVSGARFSFMKGAGARLERALINFMLDLHITRHGYTELFPPFLVNGQSMVGTGQLPKFAEDMFKIENNDYYLVPTAEVPVTNFLRDEILDAEVLPIRYVAYSACFRAEAGAAGRETRGLIRQHQFNKVEMVKFCKPEESNEELEKLVHDAEEVLQLLELPYRIIVLCTGDLGFSSSKTYDLEVWMPSYQGYKEISSCSNFTDFQARRAGIRYRPHSRAKAEFVHTLNGSGIAVGRTVAAILENYQDADGSVTIPKALVPYMGGMTRIKVL
ncbi:MAG: serine--tRNA ligase [Clostridia bacterium]|nr:serine--tRNA ligase [Clostridia bacterium]MDQ7792626.1 serine--tRNA ligase [Clostridia bacterium]